MNASKPNIIDAHVHVYSLDPSVQADDSTAPRTPAAPGNFTVEQLFAEAASVGVNRFVLVQFSTYGSDNSYLLDAISKYPTKFRGVVRLDGRDASPNRTIPLLKQHGVRGMRLTNQDLLGPNCLDSAEVQSLWKAAVDHQFALCLLINPEKLVLVDEICRRFPESRVVIDHLARIGYTGGIDNRHVSFLCNLSRHPYVYVKLSAFYCLGLKQPPYVDLIPTIRRVVDSFGPARLMWGSDSPFQLHAPHTYQSSVGLLRDRIQGLSNRDLEWIFGRTAESLFFA